MKTVYRSLFIALPIILMAAFCCYGSKGDEDFDPNQDVKKLGRNRAENTLDIRFILGADPHFNANRYSGKWRWDKNAGNGIGPLLCVSNLINAKCYNHKKNGEQGCIGVIIAGDLTRGDYWSHSQLFYRSIFEHDHSFGTDPFGEDWWDKWMPSDDDQIKYPVYPSCGNHDDESHNDRPEVRRYIEKRIKDSDALFTGKDESGKTISNYYHGIGDGVYAWEWGSVHFIQMGVWAFYGKYKNDSYSDVDWDRVKWFQDHLKAVGKEKAIILVQHFDWNSKDDKKKEWWSSDNAEMLLDLICDREVGGDSTQCDDPYNVVALFTGHAHEWGDHEDLLQGQGPRKLPSYRCDDTGHDLNRTGFYDVRINFMEGRENTDKKFIGEMTVYRQILKDGRYQGNKQKKKDKLDTVYDTSSYELFKTQEIFTEYLRFDQGEPNNGGDSGKEEDCAVIKANGRYNDENCPKKFPVLCWDKDASDWYLIDYTDLEWKDGFHYCEDIHGYEFTEPKDIGQQIKAINTLQEAGVESAWINYTDRTKEGKWQEGSPLISYFHDNEPDNGAYMFEQGWGQNCLAVLADLTFHDIFCEERINYYMCRDDSNKRGWVVKEHAPGGRYAGYSVCGEENFVGDPNDNDSLDNMRTVANDFFATTKDADAWAIWLPMSDLEEEGDWTGKKPWIATGGWHSGEPNNSGGDEDCALLGMDYKWFDVPCQDYHDNPFACRNYQTGEWQASETTSTDWIDGFEACRQLGLRWQFAAPLTKEDNDEASRLLTSQSQEIWINYTDADADGGEDLEGFWRHGFWKNWAEGEPNNANDNEDCTECYETWNDLGCSKDQSNRMVVCRTTAGAYAGGWIQVDWGGTYDEAADTCANFKGDRYKFTYPYCPSEQEALNQVTQKYHAKCWIQFHDSRHEGYFTPW